MKPVYGSADTGTTISLIGNLITGVEVHRDFRGNGFARLWMQLVCLDADRERMTLYLTIDPQEPGISKERLRRFYESLGFTIIDDDPDKRAMERKPQAAWHDV